MSCFVCVSCVSYTVFTSSNKQERGVALMFFSLMFSHGAVKIVLRHLMYIVLRAESHEWLVPSHFPYFSVCVHRFVMYTCNIALHIIILLAK